MTADKFARQLAQAIKDTMTIHEASYDHEAAIEARKKKLVSEYGSFYGKTVEQSALEAAEKNKIDKSVAFLLYLLVDDWSNDVYDWVQEVLGE